YQISHLTRFPHFRPSATLVNTRNHFRRKISTQTAPLISIKFSMDSSSNLSPLAEESSGDELRSHKGLEDETPKPPVSAFASVPDRPASQTSLQKFAPIDWKTFFDREEDIHIPNSEDVFHVYVAGSDGPVVLCLHGGGYSGLSFALSAAQIKEKARVVAMDMRGHGKTATENDLDLSIETMCKDVLAVVTAMFGNSPPAIILVGHSMGGSVAVHVAAKKLIPQLAGLVVVDVVEGTAMASLAHMQKILSSRMQHFPSIEKAIEWNVKGGSLRNIDSARVSIPTTLKYDDARRCYVYRAQLVETEQYWRGWYEGLSEKFLSCPVPKLLLLAGTDRLDRVLTIGQMQGKFQMVVVRHTGHAIQEDVPDEFAALIVNFISRNRIGPNGVEIPGLRRPLQS
ncbi:Protein phosphatase methylesterase 1, partial [Linum perenne]